MTEVPSDNQAPDSHLSMTPMSRFGMEFAQHMRNSPPGSFDAKFVEGLSDKVQKNEIKLLRLLKGLAKIDGALLVLLATKSATIPVFGFPLPVLSYAFEALLIASAYYFFFFTTTFLTNQGYVSLIQNWSKETDKIDADFLKSSYINEELFLRIFRSQANIDQQSRTDFFVPRAGFKRWTMAVNIGLGVFLLSILALHFGIQISAAWYTYQAQHLGGLLQFLVLASWACTHLAAIAIAVSCYKEFSFDIAFDPFRKTQRRE